MWILKANDRKMTGQTISPWVLLEGRLTMASSWSLAGYKKII